MKMIDNNSSYCSTIDIDYSEIQKIVRSILIVNAQNGATIEEIRDQYYELIGEKFPYIENITEFLLQIKGIMCHVNSNGTRIFHLLTSEKSQHILSMVHNQKPQKHYHNNNNKNNNNRQCINRLRHSSINETDISNSEILNYGIPPSITTNNNIYNNNACYFKDNYRYRQTNKYHNSNEKINNSWNSRQTGTSTTTGYWNNLNNNDNNNHNINNNFENNLVDKNSAHLYDFQLMGDDFFLSMAKMELNCKFKRHQGIQQSGLCISGLTIRKAIKLVNTLPYINPNVIVNIGSVDILNGRELIDIEYDLRDLKRSFINRGVTPIFTTLAPLGNFGHKNERYIIERFNDFIKRNTDLHVIDIWPCMVNQQGQTLYECYQCDARYVTGSDKPHVLWNKIGRQRILKKIKSEIELFPF